MIKRLRGIRLLLLALAAGAGLLVWGQSSGDARAALLAQRAAVASRYPANFAMQLPLEQPRSLAGAEPVFGLSWLSGWTEPDRPHYGLFLPAAAQRTGTRIWLGSEDLLLDGEPLRNGQSLTIAPGEHLLSRADGSASWPFLALYGSAIPCVFLQTDTGVLTSIYADKQYEESASITLLQPNGVLEYSGEVEAMRGHGNQTWEGHGKKSFQIKFSDRISILGMPRARRWLLIGNAYDKSLVRNHTVFSLAQAVGMPYTPEGEFVEVYINGIYHGCYLLCEKVEVDENRVNISDTDELNAAVIAKIKSKQAARYKKSSKSMPGGTRFIYYELPAGVDAATGGYLVELDFLFRVEETNHAYYMTRNEKALDIKCPALATEQQAEYIAALFQQLEDIVIPPDDSTDDSSEALSRLVDLHSFVQKYLIDEIAKYNDANQTSLYMYKYPDSISTKLFAGPIWDYDTAFGASGILEEPEGFFANQPTSYSFWSGFYRQQAFQQETRRSFANEFVPVIEKMLNEEWILQRGRELTDTACMDALRWQGEARDPQNFLQEYRQTYQQEVQDIHDFLAIRMEFLKGEWLEEA